MARTVRRAIGITGRTAADRHRPRRGLPPARRHGTPGARRPADHAHRRRERPAAADAAPAGHGGRGGALELPGGPLGPAPSHRGLRRARRPSAPSPRRMPRWPRSNASTGGSRASLPTGRPYSAADPELVTFIHVAEVSASWPRRSATGPGRSRPRTATATTRRCAGGAWPSGRAWAPRSVAEVESYLLRIRPELYAGPQARAARDWLLRGVARRPSERAVYSPRGGGRGRRPAGLGAPRCSVSPSPAPRPRWSTPPP